MPVPYRITGLHTVTIVSIVTEDIFGFMLTIIYRVTGVYRTENTVIAVPIGRVLATTANTGICSTGNTVITIRISYAIDTTFMSFIA